MRVGGCSVRSKDEAGRMIETSLAHVLETLRRSDATEPLKRMLILQSGFADTVIHGLSMSACPWAHTGRLGLPRSAWPSHRPLKQTPRKPVWRPCSSDVSWLGCLPRINHWIPLRGPAQTGHGGSVRSRTCSWRLA
jgi:hypothetical protein